VPGFGDPEARVLVVGLAPAAHGANRTGRMFTGDRSGDWLFARCTGPASPTSPTSTHVDDGLELTDCLHHLPGQVRPPAEQADPGPSATPAGRSHRELALLDRARVYLVLGGIGYAAVAGEFGVTPRPRSATASRSPSTTTAPWCARTT
jgi:uracil-DNA glycosylase